MLIKLKIPNSISEHTLVTYTNSGWVVADQVSHFGVLLSNSDERKTIEGDAENSLAMVMFQGRFQARAAETIPNGGGPIEVVNGEVRVGTAASIGFILPLAEGQPSRVAGDLVDIIIR